jgi:hypothetical protein
MIITVSLQRAQKRLTAVRCTFLITPAPAGPIPRDLSVRDGSLHPARADGRGVWVPAFAGTTVASLSRSSIRISNSNILAARRARAMTAISSLEMEGRRESRVRAVPAVLRACCENKNARKHTGPAEILDFPCAMALRLIRDRPGDRLSCHHCPLEALASSERDASTGASDPNVFTVRNRCARLSHHRVHRIPPRVSDDPDTPLVWDGLTDF